MAEIKKIKYSKPGLFDLRLPAVDGAIACAPFGYLAETACMPTGGMAKDCMTGVDGKEIPKP